MGYEKMKKEEAQALTKFVSERLKELERVRWYKWRTKRKVETFEFLFRVTLENGENDFFGAIYHFFEMSDKLFLGPRGMLEIAHHTQKNKDGRWIYQEKGKEPYTIYPT